MKRPDARDRTLAFGAISADKFDVQRNRGFYTERDRRTPTEDERERKREKEVDIRKMEVTHLSA